MSSVEDKKLWTTFSDEGLRENLKYLESPDCLYQGEERERIVVELNRELKARHDQQSTPTGV